MINSFAKAIITRSFTFYKTKLPMKIKLGNEIMTSGKIESLNGMRINWKHSGNKKGARRLLIIRY